MITDGRKVLLFLNNAPSHSDILQEGLKNIKLERNTISRLQPCNAGIIKNVKHKHIKLLIHYILARIDIRNSYASKTFKDVIILKVIKWIQTSWTEVSENTIKNCFEKCRFGKPDVAADEMFDH